MADLLSFAVPRHVSSAKLVSSSSSAAAGRRAYHVIRKIPNHQYHHLLGPQLRVAEVTNTTTKSSNINHGMSYSPFQIPLMLSRQFGTQDEASSIAVRDTLSSTEAQLLRNATAEALRLSKLAKSNYQQSSDISNSNSSSNIHNLITTPASNLSSLSDATVPKVASEATSSCFNAVMELLKLTEPPFAEFMLRPSVEAVTREPRSSLHMAFLSVISWCLSLAPLRKGLVNQALILAQRADELGLPLHLPLYQNIMTAMALHLDRDIVGQILKVAKFIPTTLHTPLQGCHIQAAAVALIKRQKADELEQLLDQLLSDKGNKNKDSDSFSFGLDSLGVDVTEALLCTLITEPDPPINFEIVWTFQRVAGRLQKSQGVHDAQSKDLLKISRYAVPESLGQFVALALSRNDHSILPVQRTKSRALSSLGLNQDVGNHNEGNDAAALKNLELKLNELKSILPKGMIRALLDTYLIALATTKNKKDETATSAVEKDNPDSEEGKEDGVNDLMLSILVLSQMRDPFRELLKIALLDEDSGYDSIEDDDDDDDDDDDVTKEGRGVLDQFGKFDESVKFSKEFEQMRCARQGVDDSNDDEGDSDEELYADDLDDDSDDDHDK